MSVLTKVFVVLVTILSVVLVALVVPFVANTENFRDQAKDANDRAAAAVASARLQQAMVENIKANENTTITALQATNANLQTQLDNLGTQLTKAINDARDAKAATERSTADVGTLAAANKQQSEITKAHEAELSTRRESMVAQGKQIVELADRIKELESQGSASDRNGKFLSERVVELEQENADLKSQINKIPAEYRNQTASGANQVSDAPTPIVGAVTKVEKVEGDTFVQINVGKNDGVQENMRFLVHRGDEYLGSLVISSVDAGASSGRMQLLKGAVSNGDRVLSGAR